MYMPVKRTFIKFYTKIFDSKSAYGLYFTSSYDFVLFFFHNRYLSNPSNRLSPEECIFVILPTKYFTIAIPTDAINEHQKITPKIYAAILTNSYKTFSPFVKIQLLE